MRLLRLVSPLAALLLARAAVAQADCAVSGTVVTTFNPVCSAIICTTGYADAGALSGPTTFEATSVETRGEVTFFSGIFTIQTANGLVTYETSGALNNVTGRFVERFTSAGGTLVSTGFATGTGFAGTLNGTTCRG